MKKRKNKGKFVKLDADLDKELDSYDVESSDDGLDAEDRILLENARGRKRPVEEEEVLPIHEESSSDSESYIDDEDGDAIDDTINEDEKEEKSSDDDLYGGGVSSEADSDFEEKGDGLPDSKAWGSKRKDYYNTDYVDKDFSGFDDEEAAIMEEEEAKAIQQRLTGQLDGGDFTLGLLDKVEDIKKESIVKDVKLEIEKKIEVDRSKLSGMDLKAFDEQETPGFNKIVENVKHYEEYEKNVLHPILKFAEESKMKDCPALNILKSKYTTICRYSLNFIMLLLLKAHRVPNIDKHPVVKRIHEIAKKLQDIDSEIDDSLKKQLLDIAEALTQNRQSKIVLLKDIIKEEITGKNRKERRKKMLKLLAERNNMENESERKKIKFADENGLPLEEYAKKLEEQNGVAADETDEEDNEQPLDENEKRGVTYQMLKNKGLTPRRKKEMRNPRVRNKNKFKKALVRRKGQVKLARKELKKYDGEISGIKKNLSRSIKLK